MSAASKTARNRATPSKGSRAGRLGKTSGDAKGEIGAELGRLDEAELAYGAWVVDRFRGFMSISEAFLVFHFKVPDLLKRFVVKPLHESGKAASHTYAMALM